MKWSRSKVIVGLGFSVALVTLIADATRSFQNTSSLIDSSRWVSIHYAILEHVEDLYIRVIEAESSRRGYVMTGDAGHLDLYRTAVEAIGRDMDSLKRLVVDDPFESQTVAELAQLVNDKLAVLQQSVEARKQGPSDTALQIALTNKGKAIQDRLRLLATGMAQAVRQSAESRAEQTTRHATRNRITVLLGDTLSILLLLAVFYLLTSEIRLRERAENEVRTLNAELEKRVVELHAANKELEAFSYTVSHDLRSPLAVIGGGARVLLDEYAGRLDDEGRKFLNMICTNSQRMGQLIDALLAFSRLGRQEIQPTTINMEELARDVFAELQMASPGRVVRLEVGALPSASGDLTLIRQVVANLLSNAIKFTRGKEQAVIEVGGSAEGGEFHYYVKDNGAGFDMQWAPKLFEVFQRLHGSDEFEGTGVGLATVQRIVQRHHGRVLAEGKVGEGATFHFTLPA